ncbi:MAG: DUF4810 domain-containing protein [Lautropia sp.]|nr:DUF4810 domain-containing protein [Lautropia sp.]
MNTVGRMLAPVALSLLLVACGGPRSLYHWGNYPDTIYSYYDSEGDWSAQERSLQKIIRAANARNRKVAPGVYAQLGLVYSRQGRDDEAREAFAQEESLYPESAVFMQRLRGGAKAGSGLKQEGSRPSTKQAG